MAKYNRSKSADYKSSLFGRKKKKKYKLSERNRFIQIGDRYGFSINVYERSNDARRFVCVDELRSSDYEAYERARSLGAIKNSDKVLMSQLIFVLAYGWPIKSGLEIHHNDSDQTNDSPENLTQLEQQLHWDYHSAIARNEPLPEKYLEELERHKDRLRLLEGLQYELTVTQV